MLNKYIAALIATVIYGVLFPLSYQVLMQETMRPISVAISSVLFFFIMLAVFEKILRKPAPHQG